MREEEMISLIKPGVKGRLPEQWADLGCGNGSFTRALAQLLPEKSRIYAVDIIGQDLPATVGGVDIYFYQADLVTDPPELPALDGILMANSLHYVDDKKTAIQRLENYFGSNQQFIVVEYDTTVSNPWVPFPISLKGLQQLFLEAGYLNFQKLGEQASRYGGKLYAALINK
ncbi:MAG: class I SAM-dependent methyltransferase [Chitinophagaceae bacterium]|nr:class I SAM-dependent methyltransferase [Chitinophagaceae bacterium]MCW5926699.1 class I SAM-dependent methyltransferase [Chitinophagaceae bacterium]